MKKKNIYKIDEVFMRKFESVMREDMRKRRD